jgi:hypothetical protein
MPTTTTITTMATTRAMTATMMKIPARNKI